MARREPPQVKVRNKELWDHFKGSEMECLAAYVYAFDCIWPRRKQSVDQVKQVIQFEEMSLPQYRQDAHHSVRPWTCYERFKRAVIAFTRKMEDNPAMNVNFKIAYIDADDSITSGDYLLEPSETEKSKKIWFEIMGKNGMAWGDEGKLKEYAAGFGGKICEKYGFKKAIYGEVSYPPFISEVGELSNLLDIDDEFKVPEKDNFEPKTQINTETIQTEPLRGRGRPRKEEAKV